MVTVVQNMVDLATVNVRNFHRTMAMARVGLVKRYSGSLLGIFWAIVRPLLFISVYWFAIQVGLRGSRPVGGEPFLLWFLPGVICWFFISDALTIGGASIRANSHLVTKLVFPVPTIPVFTVLSLYFVHLMLVGILIGIFVLSGYGLDIYFLQLFYYSFATLLFATLTAMLLSAFDAISRDVGHMVKSIMTVLFWLTPIIWPVDSVDGFVGLLVRLNPVCYLVQGYRNSLVLDTWFFSEWLYSLYFWGVILVLIFLNGYVFPKLQREFADVL